MVSPFWTKPFACVFLGVLWYEARRRMNFDRPTKWSNYSVAASKWRNGQGNVLREFTDAANRWLQTPVLFATHATFLLTPPTHKP